MRDEQTRLVLGGVFFAIFSALDANAKNTVIECLSRFADMPDATSGEVDFYHSLFRTIDESKHDPSFDFRKYLTRKK